MTCYYFDENNQIVTTAETYEECTGYVAITASDYQAHLALVEITSTDIAECFGWGFGTVIFFWFLSYQIAIARGVIRRA